MVGLTIGHVTVGVISGARPRGRIDPLHRPFQHLDGSPRLELEARPLSAFADEGSELAFDGDAGAWLAMETTAGWRFVFRRGDPNVGYCVYRAVEVDRDWRHGILYLRLDELDAGARDLPLGYPIEQLLFVGLLAHAEAAVVHAAAVIHEGVGWVFAGTHGRGKSTLARLFAGRDDVIVLNDDRVVVRCLDGGWRVFGTPWSGTVRRVSADSARLGGIFLIRHGEDTRATRLAGPDAVSRLLARCFHPYWDREALAALLSSLGRLPEGVPCYDFPFVPDADAVLSAVRATGSEART